MAKVKRRREQWRQIVKDYEACGLSATEFARREGLNANTFSWWRSELRKEAGVAGTPRLTLVAVPASIPHPVAEPIVIRLPDGIELCVPVGTEPDWVGRLADALR